MTARTNDGDEECKKLFESTLLALLRTIDYLGRAVSDRSESEGLACGTEMKSAVTFPKKVIEAIGKSKILGVRSGTEHRYTGVWVVVVNNRVFVRSWNDKPTGWFRAFKKEATGTIQIGDLEVSVRGKLVRSARIRDAVTLALGEKYNTKGSLKWVEGFAEPSRVLTTLEFVSS